MLWAYIIITILVAAVAAVEFWLEAFTAMGVTFYIVAIAAIVWAVWNLIRSFRRNNGRFAWNKWERAKLRFTGIAFIVIAIFVIVLARFACAFGAIDDGSASTSTPTATPTATAVAYGPYGGINGSGIGDGAGGENTSADDAMPAVHDLEDEQIRVLFPDYDEWLDRGSLPIMRKYKKVLTSFSRKGKRNKKLAFSDAVELGIYCGIKGQPWFDDGLGIIRDQRATDNTADPAVFKDLSKETLKILTLQAKAWIKADSEFIANAKDPLEVENYVMTVVKHHICMNPVYLDMFVQFFTKEKLATLNNKWLFDLKREFDEAYESEEGILHFMEYAPGHEGDTAWLRVTDDYFRKAVKVCLILDNFVGLGFAQVKSDENWCLPATDDVNHARTELAKYQESRWTYLLGYFGKNGKLLIKIGINWSDMRLEVFKLKTKITEKTQTDPPSTTKSPKATPKPKKKVTPKPKPKKRTTPTPKPSATPTPTAKPTPTPTPTVKPTPTPKLTDPPKDKTKDPVNNGNADTGGGQNASNDKAGPEKPKKTASPTRAPATTAKPIPTDTAVSGNPAGPSNGNITEGSQATNTNNKNDGVVTDDD